MFLSKQKQKLNVNLILPIDVIVKIDYTYPHISYIDVNIYNIYYIYISSRRSITKFKTSRNMMYVYITDCVCGVDGEGDDGRE